MSDDYNPLPWDDEKPVVLDGVDITDVLIYLWWMRKRPSLFTTGSRTGSHDFTDFPTFSVYIEGFLNGVDATTGQQWNVMSSARTRQPSGPSIAAALRRDTSMPPGSDLHSCINYLYPDSSDETKRVALLDAIIAYFTGADEST